MIIIYDVIDKFDKSSHSDCDRESLIWVVKLSAFSNQPKGSIDIDENRPRIMNEQKKRISSLLSLEMIRMFINRKKKIIFFSELN